jgi:hypothetical protein
MEGRTMAQDDQIDLMKDMDDKSMEDLQKAMNESDKKASQDKKSM